MTSDDAGQSVPDPQSGSGSRLAGDPQARPGDQAYSETRQRRRRLWVGTSWKMNKTLAEARDYAERLSVGLAARADITGQITPFVIPPATALATVCQVLSQHVDAGSDVLLGAQNAHWESAGAWTGELSVPQVSDAGAQIVEIGHSERREHFSETLETTRLKVHATLEHGLMPLLCIGEPADVRDAGGSVDYILHQAEAALSQLDAGSLSCVLVAYEPIWAIGDHGRRASAEELREPFAALQQVYGQQVAGVLYGGSVNQENAVELLGIPGVDGLFIGRAAWEAEGYLQLLELAAATRA